MPLLRDQGHDVDTVQEEGLSGSMDETIYDAARDAGRTLVTLDLDFSNPFRFPPAQTEGILVVRPPRPLLSEIRATLLTALPHLNPASVKGALHILEPGRIRVYQPGLDTAAAEDD